MLNFIKNFRADEDGAVTVDWVLLTALVVGLGYLVIGSLRTDRVHDYSSIIEPVRE